MFCETTWEMANSLKANNPPRPSAGPIRPIEELIVKRTRTEITIQTDELLILRARRKLRIACGECEGNTLLVTPEEATVLSGAGARTIYRWVEAGLVHYAEISNGTVLVCPDSVLKQASQK